MQKAHIHSPHDTDVPIGYAAEGSEEQGLPEGGGKAKPQTRQHCEDRKTIV